MLKASKLINQTWRYHAGHKDYHVVAEIDKMMRKLKEDEEYLQAWRKMKDYLESMWNLKGQLWNLEKF